MFFFSFQVIDGREPLATLKEAKTALFTHDSGKSSLDFNINLYYIALILLFIDKKLIHTFKKKLIKIEV
jgi:hypothetical protein